MTATTKTILSGWQRLDRDGAIELPIDAEIYSAQSINAAVEAFSGRCELEVAEGGRTLLICVRRELCYASREIVGTLLNLLIQHTLEDHLGG